MSGRFEPKTPVNLNPPKDDPISVDYLAKCDGKWKYPAEERFGGTAVDSGAQEHWLTELLGSSDEYPTLVAIKVDGSVLSWRMSDVDTDAGKGVRCNREQSI